MSIFTIVFIAVLALYLVLKLWLAARQQRHVGMHRNNVPQAFADDITPAQHQKAADYTLTRVRVGMIEIIWGAIVLVLWTLAGGLGWLDHTWQLTGWNTYFTGTGMILSVMLISGLLNLPLSLYSTFNVEQRFGFNKTTLKTFFVDLIKGSVLLIAIGAPLIFLALWLMARAGDLWWLYVWAVWLAFTLVMTWAYPAIIAPLFNKFHALDNAKLNERLTALLKRCGFSSNGVFVMDGSRRSAHGNAYFTGFGSNKRIVFFDTLMDTLDDPEIEAVMAHELGHFRLNHIKLRLGLSVVLGLIGFALLGWLAGEPWFYHGLGVAQASNHAALILFTLVMPIFIFPLTPLFSALSRSHEYAADHYAKQQADASALVSGLVKLFKDNATTLTPDPLYSLFYDSHPSAEARIAALQKTQT